MPFTTEIWVDCCKIHKKSKTCSVTTHVTKVWLSIHLSAITQARDLMDRGFICGDVIDAAVLLAEMSSDLICNGGKQS